VPTLFEHLARFDILLGTAEDVAYLLDEFFNNRVSATKRAEIKAQFDEMRLLARTLAEAEKACANQ
jgi:hypothetical protein